jgi:hypothetical protein
MNANGLYNGLEGHIVPGTNSGMGNGVANGIVNNEVNTKLYILNLSPEIKLNSIGVYSFRKLDINYKGPAIRVRRSSDNSERDIFFKSNGDLDEDSLTSFIGGNTGTISIWYNQNGALGRDLKSSGNSQPVIINAGSIIRANNKPAIDFDGNQDSMFTDSRLLQNLPNFTMLCVLNNNVGQSSSHIAGQSSSSGATLFSLTMPPTAPTTRLRMSLGGVVALDTTSIVLDGITKLVCTECIFPGTALISVNGIIEATSSISSFSFADRTFSIGWNAAATPFYSGLMSELLVFQPNVSTYKSAIENNINSYYKIY